MATLMRFWRRQPKPVPKKSYVDRLITLPDGELELNCVVAGACAYFNGWPLEENPWPRHDHIERFQSWRFGWLSASLENDLHGDKDRARWGVVNQSDRSN